MNQPDRPSLDDPRVFALAKSRQQVAHEGVFLPTWDELTAEEQRQSLPDARSYLHAAMKAGLVPAQLRADRAALRDRIAEALYAHTHRGWATRYADLDRDERDTYLARADAVLAVLPEPADRAVVRAETLREAADRIDRMDLPQDQVDMFDNGARWATAELRRLAGEQPAQDEARQDAADRVVAYRSPLGHYLHCTLHADELGLSWTPLSSEDLPDGGICSYPRCGVDVLIQQPPSA